ncbi:MAG: hypothetical protein AAF527_06205, partial [Pseudomonadota bacterium]
MQLTRRGVFAAKSLAHWAEAAWRADRDRRALWTPVLLGVGVALYFAAPHEPRFAPVVGALALSIAIAGTSWAAA